MTDDPETRARQLAAELHLAAIDFAAACEQLAPFAQRLAEFEAEHRAALTQAGMSSRRPAPREFAAEVALAALSALGPHVRLVSPESAQRAREQLLAPPYWPPEVSP